MGDDDVLAGDLGRDFAQLSHDVLVGESVEAVAAHALVVIGARQRIGVVDKRMAAMESGVEAGDLRRRWKRLHRRLDTGDIVRLVQRRKRNELLEGRDHGLIDQLRLDQIEPAVDDAVPDRGDGRFISGLPQPAEDGAHRDLVVDMGGRRIERERAFFARSHFDVAAGRRPDALDLARGDELGLAGRRERRRQI